MCKPDFRVSNLNIISFVSSPAESVDVQLSSSVVVIFRLSHIGICLSDVDAVLLSVVVDPNVYIDLK